MDDLLDTGRSGTLEEDRCIPDGLRESHPALLEADPIRVVECGDPAQVIRQESGVVEVVREGAHRAIEGVGPSPMGGDRPDVFAGLKQFTGDALPDVAECTCHNTRHLESLCESAGLKARG